MLKKKSDRVTRIEPAGNSNPVRPRRPEDNRPLPKQKDPKEFGEKLDKAIQYRLKKKSGL